MLMGRSRGASRRGATTFACSILALALAGCGGGGSSSSGSANTAPRFSSSAAASFVENSTDVAYQATASDAQNDTITFSIAGGADASAFSITQGGALSFTTSPNYELAADANGDNVYQVTLQASDGKANSTLAVSITVTNDREGIRVQRVAVMEGAVAIASVEEPRIDGWSNLLIGSESGSVWQMAAAGSRDLYTRVTGPSGDMTLLGMTRARGAGGQMATYMLAREGSDVWVICRGCGSSSMSGRIADVSDGSTVAIGTGPDGAAYIAVGDAAGTRAQDTVSGGRYGKVYRYSPHPDPYGGASMPEDLFLKELVGIGLRFPTGITALPDGRLLITDRGENAFDEISITTTLDGRNFGWPYFEGTSERSAGGAALAGLTRPTLAIPRGTGVRQSRGIVGGAAYTGEIAGIRNHYIFADVDGRIWSIPLSKLGAATVDAGMLEVRDEDFQPDVGRIDHPIAMTMGNKGEFYILDSDGELFEVTDARGGSIVIIPPSPN